MQTAPIRKDSQQRDQTIVIAPCSSVRRSRRAPVPNPHYLQGISQLRNIERLKDATRCSQNSKKTDSVSNSCTSLVQQQQSLHEEEWIRCILPGEEKRSLDVQLVIESPNKKVSSNASNRFVRTAREQEEEVEDDRPKDAPKKKVKLAQEQPKQQSLLGLLYSIAVKVASETATSKSVLVEQSDQAASKALIPTPKKSTVKEDKSPALRSCSWQLSNNQQMETALKENTSCEENKTMTEISSPRGCLMHSNMAESRFVQLSERFHEYKKKLGVGETD